MKLLKMILKFKITPPNRKNKSFGNPFKKVLKMKMKRMGFKTMKILIVLVHRKKMSKIKFLLQKDPAGEYQKALKS